LSATASNFLPMDTSRAMVQVISWTIFVVALLSIVAAWYLLAGLIALAIGVALYWMRNRRAKIAKSDLDSATDGILAPKQRNLLLHPGVLTLEDGKSLRVVETIRQASNHGWLGTKLQVERAETLEIEGAVVAGAEWNEGDDGGTEKEVLYVAVEEKVLGQLADVDVLDWYDQILEVGGAAKCRLRVTFSSIKNVTSIEVLGWSSS